MITVQNIINQYADKHTFIWTYKETAFWAMRHCNRIGVPYELRNSSDVINIFNILHEVGHLETLEEKQTRATREFLATQWAIKELNKMKMKLPIERQKLFQDYIYSFSKAKNKETKYKLDWDMKGE